MALLHSIVISDHKSIIELLIEEKCEAIAKIKDEYDSKAKKYLHDNKHMIEKVKKLELEIN